MGLEPRASRHEPWTMNNEPTTTTTINNRSTKDLLDSKVLKFQSFKFSKFPRFTVAKFHFSFFQKLRTYLTFKFSKSKTSEMCGTHISQIVKQHEFKLPPSQNTSFIKNELRCSWIHSSNSVYSQSRIIGLGASHNHKIQKHNNTIN